MAPKRKSTLSQNPLPSKTSSSSYPSPSYIQFRDDKARQDFSKNFFRRGIHSSSSNPTPFHVRFCDNKGRLDFSENFSRRGIHSEGQVILSDFSNTDLPTVINSRGWESLCDVPITCLSVLIQEFYSNIHGSDYSVSPFLTRVRGTCIMFESSINV